MPATRFEPGIGCRYSPADRRGARAVELNLETNEIGELIFNDASLLAARDFLFQHRTTVLRLNISKVLGPIQAALANKLGDLIKSLAKLQSVSINAQFVEVEMDIETTHLRRERLPFNEYFLQIIETSLAHPTMVLKSQHNFFCFLKGGGRGYGTRYKSDYYNYKRTVEEQASYIIDCMNDPDAQANSGDPLRAAFIESSNSINIFSGDPFVELDEATREIYKKVFRPITSPNTIIQRAMDDDEPSTSSGPST